jgi:adenine deaminase
VKDQIIIPGLIDAHVHIESSMLVPSEFAKIAVTHGTVATVSDPHEIANVLGMEGIEFMIRNGRASTSEILFRCALLRACNPIRIIGCNHYSR